MKRILIIDDDTDVRRFVVEALNLKGWQTSQASNGQMGLERALEETPDLILCDIQMPELDGYGVLRAVRAQAATRTTPFVFLTGLSDKPQVRQAMELGADDYLVKPFTMSELIAAVQARFERQAQIHESADTRVRALRESISFALPHELVTPLNSILGFSGLLMENPNADARTVREFASHIKHSGERLRALVDKFLVYAQVELARSDSEQRQAVARSSPGPTAEVIAMVAKRVAAEAEREADLTVAPGRVQSRISPSHLERLVLELLENAFKFSAPGDPVQVETRAGERMFCLKIVNFGRGLTAEQIQQISANVQFDRRIAEQQGTGLGLAIARNLVDLYGGSLQIKSQPGKHTTVILQIPD